MAAKSQTDIPSSASNPPEVMATVSGDDELQAALDFNPNDDPSILTLGPIIGDLDDATESLKAMAECAVALNFFEAREFKQTFVKIQGALKQFPRCAVIHRCRGHIYNKLTGMAIDDNRKKRCNEEAIASARKAVSMAPNDIEMIRFLAKLLCANAMKPEHYQEVFRLCFEALAIKNPVFHGFERLIEENPISMAAEAHIAAVQDDLADLIRMSMILGITDSLESMSFLSDEEGDEKTEKKVVEVPADTDQQKQNLTRTTSQRSGGEQQPELKDRQKRVMTYLDSLSLEQKRSFLRVKISDLERHVRSLDNKGSALAIVDQALISVKLSKRLSSYFCHHCQDHTLNTEAFKKHTVLQHIGNILPEARSIFPENVDEQWIELFLGNSTEILPYATPEYEKRMYVDALRALEYCGYSYTKVVTGKSLTDDKSEGADAVSHVVLDGDYLCLVMDDATLEWYLTSLSEAKESLPYLLERSLHSSGLPDPEKRKERAQNALERIELLRKELVRVRGVLDRKCEHLFYMRELHKLEEQFDRERCPKDRSYRTMLRNRLDELYVLEDETMYKESRFEIESISNTLSAGEEVIADEYGDKETCSQEEVDKCLRISIKKQKEQSVVELKEIDARITSKVARMHKLLNEIAADSFHEYEAVILAILNSYFLKELVNLADKYATNIADAVAAELIAQEEAEKEKDKKKKAKRKGAKRNAPSRSP